MEIEWESRIAWTFLESPLTATLPFLIPERVTNGIEVSFTPEQKWPIACHLESEIAPRQHVEGHPEQKDREHKGL